jgi:ketosteroid isomerase-like protein
VSSEHAEAARRGYDAVNRADWRALMDLLDPSIQWRMSTRFARAERVFEGHAGVRELFAFFEESWDGFRAEPHEFIDAEPWLIVPTTIHGRVRGSDEEIAYDLTQAWLFRDGLVIRHEVYASAEEALDAVRSGTSSTSSDAGTGRAK